MTVAIVALGELADVVSGGTPSRSEPTYFGGGIPWVKIGDMLQGTVSDTEETISESGLRGSAAKLLPAGTLLLSIFATIGRTAVLGVDAATNQAIAGIQIHSPTRVDRGYLRRYLEFTSAKLADQGRGVAQANINLSILRSHPVPLPPIEEQRRIASILDAADALRAKRRQALQKLDTLTQSIFIDMFGQLEENKYGWPVVEFGSIVSDARLGLVRSAGELATDQPLPYIRMNAIQPNGELDLADVKRTQASESEIAVGRLAPGDLLFNTRNSRDLVGKTAIFREPGTFLFNNNLLRLRFKTNTHPEYVNAALRSRALQRSLEVRKAGTTNVFAIYFKDLRTVPIPLPPLERQQEFAERVGAARGIGGSLRESTTRLDALFASLQHRAFRGEL